MALIEIERPTAAHAVMEDVCDRIARRAQSGSVGTCPVELTDAFVSLSASQSCGKCVPCRVGLAQMRNLVEAILDGRANERDVDVLERTARNAYLSADCAIGYEAGAMVLRAVKGFRDDFVSHATQGRCTAGSAQCRALPRGVSRSRRHSRLRRPGPRGPLRRRRAPHPQG